MMIFTQQGRSKIHVCCIQNKSNKSSTEIKTHCNTNDVFGYLLLFKPVQVIMIIILCVKSILELIQWTRSKRFKIVFLFVVFLFKGKQNQNFFFKHLEEYLIYRSTAETENEEKKKIPTHLNHHLML